MMLLAVFSWWYTAGWAKVVQRSGKRISSTLNTFSVGTLFVTLFEPFRQISANETSTGAFDSRLRAFGDRLFSRVFGAVVRTIFIIMGLISAVVVTLLCALQIAIWPFVPFLPIAGCILAATGVSL